jgi:hypothetical protein
MVMFPSEQPVRPQVSKPIDTVRKKTNDMGDKSPKSIGKQASQKQTKATGALQKKQQAIAAKQVAGKKK